MKLLHNVVQITQMNNIKVLVTRPIHQSKNLCELLSAMQITPICFPAICIEKIQVEQWPDVHKFDFFIFTSTNAVLCAPLFFLQQLQETPKRAIISIGKATQQALVDRGLYDCQAPEVQMTGQGVLHFLQKNYKNLARKKFLIVTGEKGIDYLYHQLVILQCEVEKLFTYRRSLPQVNSYENITHWMQALFSITMITSCAALENLLSMLHDPVRAFLLKSPIIVPSARIVEYAMQNQANEVWLASSALDESMVNCLLANLQSLIK